MSDIPVYNETGTDLPPWILAQIKAEMIEYFGESIHAIRIQAGIQRHAYNAKTHEVRYAFFLSDFDFETPIHSAPRHDAITLQPASPTLADDMPGEIDLGDEIEFEEDEAFVAILDDDVFEDFGNDHEELQALMKDHDPDDEPDASFD
jgi:hypothetical protein